MRPRAAVGLLLLVVTAHAFVAGATHFHRRAVSAVPAGQTAVRGSEGGERSVPLAGDEVHCLLCRLNRGFVSDLQNATFSLAPPPADVIGITSLSKASARSARSLLPSGRAPPSV
ncbi:MAG: hypothetical protein LC795_18545 [Acidobacteria bacterium]|nr:hypothetical protein [Acidobacteriota bacterium]